MGESAELILRRWRVLSAEDSGFPFDFDSGFYFEDVPALVRLRKLKHCKSFSLPISLSPFLWWVFRFLMVINDDNPRNFGIISITGP